MGDARGGWSLVTTAVPAVTGREPIPFADVAVRGSSVWER
jgi:hypothetical protein